MAARNFRAKARRIYGKEAVWIYGSGQYALLAWCGQLTITLHQNQELAELSKQGIDINSCGGHCYNNHEIVDLEDM